MILFGHRGARGETPENTLAGFMYALQTGVNGIELDIHLSADEQPVVIHDDTVDRTTDATGPVFSFTAEELSQLNACGEFDLRKQWGGVPTLGEALEIIHAVAHLQLEIKSSSSEKLEKICKLIAENISEFALEKQAVVTSFNPVALEIMHRINPIQRCVLISMNNDDTFFTQAEALGCTGVCVFLPNSSPETVSKAHELGFEVTGWLGNSEGDIDTLISWGVENITSDYPTRAMRILRERKLM